MLKGTMDWQHLASMKSTFINMRCDPKEKTQWG